LGQKPESSPSVWKCIYQTRGHLKVLSLQNQEVLSVFHSHNFLAWKLKPPMMAQVHPTGIRHLLPRRTNELLWRELGDGWVVELSKTST